MVLRVRADFAVMEYVSARDHDWVASPERGVDRVMLDRIGDEIAVATSIVRYQPGSRFGAHMHERGEEFLVLDGVFADEHREYPAGTYVRNPPGTRHTPRSDPGCTLFVKLRQFLPGDLQPVVVDIRGIDSTVPDGSTRSHVLHKFDDEVVFIVDGGKGGIESFPACASARDILMLSGEADVQGQRLTPLDWLRAPAGKAISMRFIRAGRAFVKTRPVLEQGARQGRMNS